ncbi:MAG: fatty acid CoA ligase family protein [Nitrospinaceae bacterium]
MEPSHFNIAATLEQVAKKSPDLPAVRVPWQKREISFAQLHEESSRTASGLIRLGVRPGARFLLLVPFSIEFISLTYALFKAGAVPVLIDPGLGRQNMLRCIEETQPEGMIGIPRAHAVRKIRPRPFRSVRFAITTGKGWPWGGIPLARVNQPGGGDFSPAAIGPEDPAAILFTSGSTGPPKGVLYTHRMFFHQVDILKSTFGIQPGETDLPTFPLFGLFSTSMGMTCILPRMDPTHPARVDPRNIVQPILDYEITNTFGSPALWDTVSRYCAGQGIQLPSLKRILMAGAPAAGTLLKRIEHILMGNAEVFTPYGATEALPVTSIGSREILAETWERSEKGAGTCVGRPVPGIEIKIIGINDGPIPTWEDAREQPPGKTGEIVVRGPWVTREYFNKTEATRLAKIGQGNTLWHRMGDLGWMDDRGRLWFCGRKNQRVQTAAETLFTIPCEAVFNRHPEVKRSALVGVGPREQQRAFIVIEPENSKRIRMARDKESFTQELLDLGSRFPHTRQIKKILFHPDFPVDVRHNAKIFREKLARWAEKQS